MDASKKARLITLAATRRYHHLVADRPATTPNTVEQSNTIRAAIQTYGTHSAGITRGPKEIAIHEHTSPTQLKIPAVGADLPLCIATSLLQNIVPEVVPHVRSRVVLVIVHVTPGPRPVGGEFQNRLNSGIF
jgi:hypothetical protein